MRSVEVDTPLGQIRFSADAEPLSGGAFELELRVVEYPPVLPPGMSVRRARAVLLRATSDNGLQHLDYRCRFDSHIEGGPESGEHLDAQSWQGQDDIVLIGTEDGEALSARMPWLQTSDDLLTLVKYQENGLVVPLTGIPAGVSVTLHFIIAENSNPESVECSAWFAVGVPHDQLLLKMAGNPPHEADGGGSER